MRSPRVSLGFALLAACAPARFPFLRASGPGLFARGPLSGSFFGAHGAFFRAACPLACG
jgi:hypothetical protein